MFTYGSFAFIRGFGVFFIGRFVLRVKGELFFVINLFLKDLILFLGFFLFKKSIEFLGFWEEGGRAFLVVDSFVGRGFRGDF